MCWCGIWMILGFRFICFETPFCHPEACLFLAVSFGILMSKSLDLSRMFCTQCISNNCPILLPRMTFFVCFVNIEVSIMSPQSNPRQIVFSDRGLLFGHQAKTRPTPPDPGQAGVSGGGLAPARGRVLPIFLVQIGQKLLGRN